MAKKVFHTEDQVQRLQELADRRVHLLEIAKEFGISDVTARKYLLIHAPDYDYDKTPTGGFTQEQHQRSIETRKRVREEGRPWFKSTEGFYKGTQVEDRNYKAEYRTVTIHHLHPLRLLWGASSYVHRVVLFDKIGYGPHLCFWCGRVLSWGGTEAYSLHTDHMNGNKRDNRPQNLVPSCKSCNALELPARMERYRVLLMGE